MQPEFRDIVALQPQHAALLEAIRSLVLRLHPDGVEVSRPGDRAVSWGLGPRKMSEAYADAMPFRAHVNLGFYRGAHLPDPDGLLKGTGKALRHVSLRHAEEVGSPALASLVAEAIEEQKRFLAARAEGA